MARRPRTRFAASFVVCIATAGCSHEATTGRGSGIVSQPPSPPPAAADAQQVAASPLRHWTIQHRADGTCWTVDDPCTRLHLAPGQPIPPCNPPPPFQTTCVPTGFTVEEVEPGKCTAVPPPIQCPTGPNAPTCNPPPPMPVDCPAPMPAPSPAPAE